MRAASLPFGWRRPQKLVVLVGVCALLAIIQAALGQEEGLTVTATCGNTLPYPALIDDTITTSLDASASNIPTPPDECFLNSPTWSWEITQVQYSPDGTNWESSPGGDSHWVVQGSSSSPVATGYSTFTDNDLDGGYWEVTYKATVVYTDTCSNSWTACGSVDDKKKVVTVTILRKPDGGADYLPIKDNNQKLLVGQFVNLKAKVMPAGEEGTYQWKNPPGVTFYDYKFDKDNAKVTRLPADGAADPDKLLTSSELWFYWTDAADGRKVTCTFTPTVGAAATNPETKLNVKSPKISEFTTKDTLGKARKFVIDGKLKFGLFDADGADTGEPGIRWKATVDSINADWGAEGQWQYVQKVYVDKTYKDDANKTHTWKPAKTWLLDTDDSEEVPYAGPFATGAGSKGSNDSPQTHLANSDRLVTVALTKFELYVMFLPPPGETNSRWVPLQVINWSYKGTSTWAMGPVWTVTGASEAADENGAASTSHPEWTSNHFRGGWVPD